MGVKEWLETAAGCRVKENCFRKPPALPYIVYLQQRHVRGADQKNNIEELDITVELYTEDIDKTVEGKLEEQFNKANIEYEKDRIWLSGENMLQTMYDFSVIKKREE